jgi:hypothetical protein
MHQHRGVEAGHAGGSFGKMQQQGRALPPSIAGPKSMPLPDVLQPTGADDVCAQQ